MEIKWEQQFTLTLICVRLNLFLTDYPDGNNSSEYIAQPTTYLPENFTYAQNLPCPERLPSMSKFNN